MSRSSSHGITSKPSSRARPLPLARVVQRPAHAGHHRLLGQQQALLHRAPERRAVEDRAGRSSCRSCRSGRRAARARPGRARRRGRAARRARSCGRRRARSASRPARTIPSSCCAICATERRRVARRGVDVAPVDHGLGGEAVDLEVRVVRAAAAIEPARTASGPNRAPTRKLVPVSNGTPTTATSTPSRSFDVRAARERADAGVAGREERVGGAVTGLRHAWR